MQPRLVKAICLPLLIAMVLLIGVTPVSAQSMEGVDGCNSYLSQEQSPVPSCCVTPDCPLSRSVTANVVPSTSRLTQDEVDQPVRLPADPVSEASTDQKGPPPWDAPQQLAAPPGAEPRCRDCLHSEEPPLV